jgi:hypothetical protein
MILLRFIFQSPIETPKSGYLLPKEITDADKFLKISETASECRVKRLADVVKLKLRTPRELYTLKVDPAKAAELLKQVKCEVIEA